IPVTVKDANGGTAGDSFLLTVNPVNDAPVARNDAYTTNEDTALTIAAPGVLGNDTDVDVSDTRTAVLTSGPTNGSLTLNADGSFTDEPRVDVEGSGTSSHQPHEVKVGAAWQTAT